MDTVMNKKTRNKIKKAIETFDIKQVSARKKLISYLKPILYNHKDMILKTRKENDIDMMSVKKTKSKSKPNSKPKSESESETESETEFESKSKTKPVSKNKNYKKKIVDSESDSE